MKLTAVGQIKNSALYEAFKKFGTIKAFAEYLGVHFSTAGRWISMKDFPNLSHCRKLNPSKWDSIEARMMAITGLTLEEIFPQELLGSEFLQKPKTFEIEKEIQVEQLLSAPREYLQLGPVQEDMVIEQERDSAIEAALESLPKRMRFILEHRFGLIDGYSKTRLEISEMMAISPPRVAQLEHKALQKLRKPERSRKLRPFVE